MNLITSLMRGIRQVRTPLAVGALWLVVTYLAFRPVWREILSENDELARIQADVLAIPLVYLVGALAFVAYLVGSASMGLSGIAVSGLNKGIDALKEHISNEKRLPFRSRWRLTRGLDQSAVRGPILDTISAAYSKAGIDNSAAYAFPVEIILDQFDLIALQLWHKAPDQYQEYDRLHAEVSFRIGISLPLVVIGVLMGLQVSWWLGALVVLGALVLALQTRRLKHDQDVLLANAIYQGLAESAVVKSVVRELRDMGVPKRANPVVYAAATSIALSRAGDPDGANAGFQEAAWEIGELVDFGEGDWEVQVDELAAEAVQLFNENHETETLDLFMGRVNAKKAAVVLALQGDLADRPADRVGRGAWRDS